MASIRKFSDFKLFSKKGRNDDTSQVARVSIPFVPKGVDISKIHFDKKGKLTFLNEAETKQLKNLKLKYKNTRYSKSEMGQSIPYGAIECDKMLWLICSKQIGSGVYGRVKIVFNTKTRQFYALKLQNSKVKDSTLELQKLMDKTKKELSNIQTLGQTPQKDPIMQRFAKDKSIPQAKTMQTLMIMDYTQGLDIEEILKRENQSGHFIPTPLRFHIAREIFKAIYDLHTAKQFIHADISLGNVKFNFISQVANLIDFGNSISMHKGPTKMVSDSENELTPELDLRAAVHVVGSLFYLNIAKPLSENPLVKQGLMSEDTLACLLKALQKSTSLIQLISFFNAIEKKEQIKSSNLQVGIVNIQSLLNENKASLIAQLKTMDEVWFVDTNSDTDMKTILILKAELEEAGIIVGDQIFVGQDEQLLKQKVHEHLNERTVKADCQLQVIKPSNIP